MLATSKRRREDMSLQEFLAWHIQNSEINYIECKPDGTEGSYIVQNVLTRLLIKAFAHVPHRCYIRPMNVDYHIENNNVDPVRFQTMLKEVLLMSGSSDSEGFEQPIVRRNAWPASHVRMTYDGLNEVDPHQYLARAGLLSTSPALSTRVSDEEAIRMLRRRGLRVCQYAPVDIDAFTVAMASGHYLEPALVQTIKDYDDGSTGWLTGNEELLRGNMLLRVHLPLHGFPDAKIWFEDADRRVWRVPNDTIFSAQPSARFGMSRRRSKRRHRRSESRVARRRRS